MKNKNLLIGAIVAFLIWWFFIRPQTSSYMAAGCGGCGGA
jgi:hypothetical protein